MQFNHLFQRQFIKINLRIPALIMGADRAVGQIQNQPQPEFIQIAADELRLGDMTVKPGGVVVIIFHRQRPLVVAADEFQSPFAVPSDGLGPQRSGQGQGAAVAAGGWPEIEAEQFGPARSQMAVQALADEFFLKVGQNRPQTPVEDASALPPGQSGSAGLRSDQTRAEPARRRRRGPGRSNRWEMTRPGSAIRLFHHFRPGQGRPLCQRRLQLSTQQIRQLFWLQDVFRRRRTPQGQILGS